tara:strand:- start:70 stop:354 length:285 start_codon:yes stop_codon:yes gene_type:complete
MNSYERIYEILINENEVGKPAGKMPRQPHPYGSEGDVGHDRDVAAMDKWIRRGDRKELQARLRSREAGSPLTRKSQRRLTRVKAAIRSVFGGRR